MSNYSDPNLKIESIVLKIRKRFYNEKQTPAQQTNPIIFHIDNLVSY